MNPQNKIQNDITKAQFVAKRFAKEAVDCREHALLFDLSSFGLAALISDLEADTESTKELVSKISAIVRDYKTAVAISALAGMCSAIVEIHDEGNGNGN
jgi:hypothetical protein